MFEVNTPKVGINGFGRIGFCALRKCLERGIPVLAINASRTPAELAYLFQYDSVHGPYNGAIKYDENHIVIEGKKIAVTNKREPSEIPWGSLGVEYVIDCTGKFLKQESAKSHLEAGAKKVIISAPAKDEETPMFVV